MGGLRSRPRSQTVCCHFGPMAPHASGAECTRGKDTPHGVRGQQAGSAAPCAPFTRSPGSEGASDCEASDSSCCFCPAVQTRASTELIAQ